MKGLLDLMGFISVVFSGPESVCKYLEAGIHK
jgi:hypothetical protein